MFFNNKEIELPDISQIETGSLVKFVEPTAISYGVVEIVEDNNIVIDFWNERDKNNFPNFTIRLNEEQDRETFKRCTFYNTALEKHEIISKMLKYSREIHLPKLQKKVDNIIAENLELENKYIIKDGQ